MQSPAGTGKVRPRQAGEMRAREQCNMGGGSHFTGQPESGCAASEQLHLAHANDAGHGGAAVADLLR